MTGFRRVCKNFRKATVSFVISVLLSVCLNGTNQIPRDEFLLIWRIIIFRKPFGNIEISLKYDNNNGYFT